AALHLAARNAEQESCKVLSNRRRTRGIAGSGVGRQELKTRRDVIAAAHVERTVQPQVCAVSQVVIATQVGDSGTEVMNQPRGDTVAVAEVSKPRERPGAGS